MCKFKDTIFVIRSVGERTEQLCEKLLIDQDIPLKNIQIIREAPFSAALKKHTKSV